MRKIGHKAVDFSVEIAGYCAVNNKQGSSFRQLATTGICPQMTQNAVVVITLYELSPFSRQKQILKTATTICTEVQQAP
jgi:hypothetical protein